MASSASTALFDGSTHEDAVIGPSSFLAQITPAPDGKSFAAVREAVGQAPEIVLKRVGDKDWRPLTKLNSTLMQGFDGYPEVRADLLARRRRARHGGLRPAAAGIASRGPCP